MSDHYGTRSEHRRGGNHFDQGDRGDRSHRDMEGEPSEQVAIRKQLTTFNSYARGFQFKLQRPDAKARVLLQPHFNSMGFMPNVGGHRSGPAMGICSRYLMRCFVKPQNRSKLNTASWSGNGRHFICGTEAGTFIVWSADTFKLDRAIEAHFVEKNGERVHSPVRAMDWGHYGQLMASADDNGRVQYYNANLSKAGEGVEAHEGSCRGISFSPSDTKYMSCGDDATVKIWDVENSSRGIPSQNYTEHQMEVTGCEWHPYRSLGLSVGKDMKAKIWDPRCDKSVATIYAHKKHINCCGWSCGGDYFATGSKDLSAKVFDLRTLGKDNAAVQTYVGHEGAVTTLAWHPYHDRLLLSGAFNGSMAYWVVGESIGPHTGISDAHRNSINYIVWHPMGHLVCSASFEGALKVWTREQPGSKCEPETVIVRTQQGEIEEKMSVGYGPLPSPEESPSEEIVNVSLARGGEPDMDQHHDQSMKTGHSSRVRKGGDDQSRREDRRGANSDGGERVGGDNNSNHDRAPSRPRVVHEERVNVEEKKQTDFMAALAAAKAAAAGVGAAPAPASSTPNVASALAALASKLGGAPPPPPPNRKRGRN
jgi:polyadenylation factor subunit 2